MSTCPSKPQGTCRYWLGMRSILSKKCLLNAQFLPPKNCDHVQELDKSATCSCINSHAVNHSIILIAQECLGDRWYRALSLSISSRLGMGGMIR